MKRKKVKRWGLVAVFLGLIILIGLVWTKMGGGDRLLATAAVISAGLLIAGELWK